MVGERILPLHLQWLKAIQDHNVQLAFSPNTIYANITKLLGYFHVVYNPTALVTVMLFFVSSIFFIWIYKRKRQGVSFKEWAVLICLIPILMHTDTEHFMWSLPFFFIFLIGLNRSSEKLIRCLGLIYIVILSIPFTFNSPDLVGKIWSKRFDEGGIGLAVQFSLILVLGLETVKYLKNKRIRSSS
ncbi:MAG: hypothetical protein ACKO8Q_03245 [Bacteroidota bacterium]